MSLPLIKPSDAKAWSECARRVWLDNKADFDIEPSEDEFDQLVITLGLVHEQSVLDRLSASFDVQEAISVDDTARLMGEGVQVIYQAQAGRKQHLLFGHLPTGRFITIDY